MSEILDAPAQATTSDLTASLTAVQGHVAEFDKIAAGLAALAQAHPVDVVCDVTTPAGMKQAVAGRAAWRDPRVAVEKARKAAKAPVLELGRKIDAFAAEVTEIDATLLAPNEVATIDGSTGHPGAKPADDDAGQGSLDGLNGDPPQTPESALAGALGVQS